MSKLHEIMLNRSLGMKPPIAIIGGQDEYDEYAWDAGIVVPGLYVGSLRAAIDTDSLRKRNIQLVLTFAGRLPLEVPQDIKHIRVDIADHPSASLLCELVEMFVHMDAILLGSSTQSHALETGLTSAAAVAAQNLSPLSPPPSLSPPGVLVHCASGISRSVSLCCAWLMCRRQLTYAEAIGIVRKGRCRANPNVGFRAQLAALEEAQNDIDAAIVLYNERYVNNGAVDIGSLITEQRSTANELHARVDILEDKYQALRATTTSLPVIEAGKPINIDKAELQTFVNELLSIQSTADGLQWVVDDGAARIIKKSAMSKVHRLLADIEGLSQSSTAVL
jgi:hypothetical protein